MSQIPSLVWKDPPTRRFFSGRKSGRRFEEELKLLSNTMNSFRVQK